MSEFDEMAAIEHLEYLESLPEYGAVSLPIDMARWQHSLMAAEIERLRSLARYMYLTLGFYATPYNYDPQNVCTHPITGEPASGILFDGGDDAREAMKRVNESGLRDYIVDGIKPQALNRKPDDGEGSI